MFNTTSHTNLPPISVEEFFAYMEFRDAGYSEEQIETAALGPMREANEANYEETAQRLLSLISERVTDRQEENSGFLSESENVNITQYAQEVCEISQEELRYTAQIQRELVGLIDRTKEKLVEARENLQGFIEESNLLNTTLANVKQVHKHQETVVQFGTVVCERTPRPQSNPASDEYPATGMLSRILADRREKLRGYKERAQTGLAATAQDQRTLDEMSRQANGYLSASRERKERAPTEFQRLQKSIHTVPQGDNR